MNEEALIEALERGLARPDPRVRLGIGDDAAVLEDGTVLSVDAVVEGVHFQREWLSLAELGHRGTVAALSDLAAMGATPVAILSSLTGPDAGEIAEIMSGVGEAAGRYGAVVIGGNVARSTTLSLHSTVIGRVGAAWRRSGARVGDAIYVTGTVGAAALGWRAIDAGLALEPFVSRWRRPSARFDVVPHLQPTSCVDISDGVARELGLLADASRVGMRLEVAALPVEAEMAAAAAQIGVDPDELALSGGEDYELLFTAPASLDPALATRVGEVVDRPGVHLVRRDGAVERPRGGHQHY